jgi:hypothetical protein
MRFNIAVLAILLSTVSAAVAQTRQGEGPLNPAPPTGITPEQIIQRFAAKEKEFKAQWEKYTYRQDIKVEDVDGGGQFRQTSDMVFNDQGRRVEHVLFAPQPTLVRFSMSPEDFDDIQNRYPFALTTDDLPQYQVLYVGQQRIDELDCYAFDVAPRTIEKGKRYFQGRIWVDNRDFQIVRTYGKSVPDIRKNKNQENLFPTYETLYDQIDDKYWFPVWSHADDVLHFSSGDVPMRITVKYTNYKRFGSDVKITYQGQTVQQENKPEQPKKPQ